MGEVEALKAQIKELSAQFQQALLREIGRRRAKTVVSRVRKAAKRLAAPRPDKSDMAKYRADRTARKAARRVLRSCGGLVG